MLLAAAMGACLGLGYLLPHGSGQGVETVLGGWIVSLSITGVSGIVLLLVGRGTGKTPMLRRDAIGIVGIGWAVCSLFVALPYLFCEPKLPLAEAVFEGVSGLTTTGATVFADLTNLPATVLLWRSLTQWIGGMGILAMFVLVLSNLGASGKSLFQTESSAHAKEIVGTTMRQTVRSLWLLYVALTGVCFVGLWALDMNLFQALNHAMTTVATAGFGTENTSIDRFGIPTKVWIIAFMFLCGMSFPLYLALLRRNRDWGVLRRHEETWVFAAIVVGISSALVFNRALAGDFDNAWGRDAIDTVFNTVSIATTTGYSVGDYDAWPLLSKGLILLLMLVGGCAGSTAGGLKVGRLILWFKMLRAEVRRAYRPHQVVGLKINGRVVPEGTQGQLFIILTAAATCAVVSSYLLAVLEPGVSVEGCVAAAVACLCNIGPAFAEFGPTQNYSALSPPSMILLSVLMIVGRLEYIAVLVLLSRTLWKHY